MPECVVANIKIHVEVPILLIFFAFVVSESVKTNLIIFKTCYVTLGHNKSECALLGSKHPDNETTKLEKIVEPYAAVLNMVESIIGAGFSAVTCLFVGPWSDRFGRKPFLVFPVLGFLMAFVLLAIFAALEDISPWYVLITSVPVILTGGGSSYLTVLLCYITDVTNEKNRGTRMGVFEAVLACGIFLGNISSSYIFEATNYYTVFLTSALCCLLNLIFTLFFIPESLTNPESEGRFKGLFKLTNMLDMVKTTFKKRRNYDRFVVLSCVFMLSIYITTINGDGALIFLFVREKFHWSLQQYTLYSAAHNVAYVLTTAIGIYLFHKLFKVSEVVMVLIGFLSMFLGMLLMGFAKYDWQVYVAAISRSFGGVLGPMVRSLVSKIVPNEEIGNVFSLIVASESLIGMGGSPIFTAIYNATLSMDPAIYNFVEAGIYFGEIILTMTLIVAIKFSRRNNIYQQVINEENCEERSTVDEPVT